MNPGVLDKRVEIYKPQAVPDNMGGRLTTMVKACDAWVEFKRPRFTSTVAEGTPVTEITQGIRIRAVDGIRKGWQVRYKNRTYEILHVDDSVKGEITLTTQEAEK